MKVNCILFTTSIPFCIPTMAAFTPLFRSLPLLLLTLHFIILSHYPEFVPLVEAGKRKIHITDDLDDVEDNEEDDSWKEWGKTSSPSMDKFDPPPMDMSDMELPQIQEEMMKRHFGPTFGFVKLQLGLHRTPGKLTDNADAEVSEDGIIESFGNDDEALDAFDNGVMVADLSHFGRVRVGGEDRVQFLHNQTTADFESLSEGQGCDTVFVTPTARTIDIAHAWIMKNAIILLVSPGSSGSITNMLNKYIFFSDKVEIQDITKKTCLFIIAGPKSNEVLEGLSVCDLVGQPYGTHRHYSVNGMPVTIAVGNLISEDGFSLFTTPAAAGSVWETLLSQGATPMGANAWEKLRITQGKPAYGKELTNEFNVLEACLWNSISLTKGCYKGQETVARLITYDGIKQRLWGLVLSAATEAGSPITVDGKKVGKLTSYTTGIKETKHFGLGYIKKKAASAGDTVVVGDNIIGTVVEVPFVARQCPPSKS